MIDRRTLLSATVAGAGLCAVAPGLALARLPGERRLVVVILRGGLDGLAAVPPYGDHHYERTRGDLALERPGPAGGVIDLDGFFALHPALEGLHPLFTAGELALLHATAAPYRARSHFDAQDVLENGTGRPRGARDGWLARAIAALDPAAARAPLGLAVGPAVPLVLRGEAAVASWAPQELPRAEDALLAQVSALWEGDPQLGPALAEGLRMRAMSDEVIGAKDNKKAGRPGPRAFAASARVAGKMLTADDGPRIAVLEIGGWDSHANQGRDSGQLARNLDALAGGLLALKETLGSAWRSTAVLAVTEFGRTVRPNGTKGTDHGIAGAAFALGGAVVGGRVLADWPGLGDRDLHEGRDLAPTTDLRTLFKAALIQHLGLSPRVVEAEVFPESAALRPLPGLFQG